MTIEIERYETADWVRMGKRVWSTKVTVNGKSVTFSGKLADGKATERALVAWAQTPQIFR